MALHRLVVCIFSERSHTALARNDGWQWKSSPIWSYIVKTIQTILYIYIIMMIIIAITIIMMIIMINIMQ